MGGRLGRQVDPPALVGLQAQGQGADAAHAGAVHVDDALQQTGVGQLLFRRLPGVVEAETFPRREGGALHHGDFVDPVGEAFCDK